MIIERVAQDDVADRLTADGGRPGLRLACGWGAAVLVGILGDEGLHWGTPGVALFTAASLWLVLSFGAGRAVGRPLLSALVGAAALDLSLLTYYAWMATVHDVDWSTLMSGGYRGSTFLAAGLVIGGVSGLLGGLTRGRERLVADLAWSGLLAVPLVDGIIQYRYSGRDDEWATVTVFAVVTLAIAAWALASRARPAVLLLAVPLATAVLYAGELFVLREVFGRLTWL